MVAPPRILACPPRGSVLLISENQMYANFGEHLKVEIQLLGPSLNRGHYSGRGTGASPPSTYGRSASQAWRRDSLWSRHRSRLLILVVSSWVHQTRCSSRKIR